MNYIGNSMRPGVSLGVLGCPGVIRPTHCRQLNENEFTFLNDVGTKKLYQLFQLCTARTAWSESDQAVRAVHSCNSW